MISLVNGRYHGVRLMCKLYHAATYSHLVRLATPKIRCKSWPPTSIRPHRRRSRDDTFRGAMGMRKLRRCCQYDEVVLSDWRTEGYAEMRLGIREI